MPGREFLSLPPECGPPPSFHLQRANQRSKVQDRDESTSKGKAGSQMECNEMDREGGM